MQLQCSCNIVTTWPLKLGVLHCIEKMSYCIFDKIVALQANGERRQQVPACDYSREMEEVLTCVFIKEHTF